MKNISIILFFLAAMLWAEEEEHVLTLGGSAYVLLGIDAVVVLSGIEVGTLGMLDLGYRYLGRGQSHAFRLLVGGGDLFSYPGVSAKLDLRSSFRVYENETFALRLGTYALGFYESFDIESYEWFTTRQIFGSVWAWGIGIGIAGEVLFRVNRHNVELIVTLPLGAYLSRPYLSMEDERALARGETIIGLSERGVITSLHEYQHVEFTMIYSYRINERVSFVTRYDFLFRAISIAQASVIFVNTFSFNVHVHFR